MNKPYRQKFLGTLVAIAVFLVCLCGINEASQKPSEDTAKDDLQVHLSSTSVLNDVFYSKSEAEGRYQAAVQFLASSELPGSVWNAAYTASSGPAPSFSDVQEDDWFYQAVMWAVDEEITNGVGENKFGPGATCSNAQVLTFLWRAYGKPGPVVGNPFQDVSFGDYFYAPALWACERNMVSGAVFSPDKECTRAMAVEYLWKAAGSPTATSSARFTDVPVSSSISQAVAWAVESGITTGTSSKAFSPDKACTRAQIVTFLYRDIQYLNTSSETITLPSGTSYTGRLVNGVPDGNGVLTIPGLGYYDGDFQNGQRNGTGTFSWTSGETYTGAWIKDKIFGAGTLTLASGDTLTGTFSGNGFSQGTYCFSEGYRTVEVPVSDGKLQTDTAVKISLLDGSSYSGPIIRGKLNGFCTITFANGDSYAGNVTDNLKSGTGTYTWGNGAWYEGSWSEDEMSGTGIYYYTASATGERLSGTFSHNDPVGVCTYFSASNTKYLTTWRDRQCVDITRG